MNRRQEKTRQDKKEKKILCILDAAFILDVALFSSPRPMKNMKMGLTRPERREKDEKRRKKTKKDEAASRDRAKLGSETII